MHSYTNGGVGNAALRLSKRNVFEKHPLVSITSRIASYMEPVDHVLLGNLTRGGGENRSYGNQGHGEMLTAQFSVAQRMTLFGVCPK